MEPPFKMGTPFGVHPSVLSAPLTESDLDDYERRLGNPCPTEEDAIRFTMLGMRPFAQA